MPLLIVNQGGRLVTSLFAELSRLFVMALADFKAWVLALILGADIVL